MAGVGPLAPVLDADACYRALESRDARFDGAFFTGVTSTPCLLYTSPSPRD